MAQCKYCRTDGFYWQRFRFGWRLIERSGDLHECAEGRAAHGNKPKTSLEKAIGMARAAYTGAPPRKKMAKALLMLDSFPSSPASGPEFEFDDL